MIRRELHPEVVGHDLCSPPRSNTPREDPRVVYYHLDDSCSLDEMYEFSWFPSPAELNGGSEPYSEKGTPVHQTSTPRSFSRGKCPSSPGRFSPQGDLLAATQASIPRLECAQLDQLAEPGRSLRASVNKQWHTNLRFGSQMMKMRKRIQRTERQFGKTAQGLQEQLAETVAELHEERAHRKALEMNLAMSEMAVAEREGRLRFQEESFAAEQTRLLQMATAMTQASRSCSVPASPFCREVPCAWSVPATPFHMGFDATTAAAWGAASGASSSASPSAMKSHVHTPEDTQTPVHGTWRAGVETSAEGSSVNAQLSFTEDLSVDVAEDGVSAAAVTSAASRASSRTSSSAAEADASTPNPGDELEDSQIPACRTGCDVVEISAESPSVDAEDGKPLLCEIGPQTKRASLRSRSVDLTQDPLLYARRSSRIQLRQQLQTKRRHSWVFTGLSGPVQDAE